MPNDGLYIHGLLGDSVRPGTLLCDLSTTSRHASLVGDLVWVGVNIDHFYRFKISLSFKNLSSILTLTRGPKGHISCTWVQCATFLKDRPGPRFLFTDRPKQKNTNVVEDVDILLSVKFRWIPFSSFRGKVENVSANQRLGGHLDFPIGPKNTNFVHDIEILPLVKFHWIPFSGFRGEIENVSAN